MKTTNYRLQTKIEHLNPIAKKEWFKNYIKQILESDKPYHAKADYIGLSLQELQNKIEYLAEDIKELQRLKKELVEAKSIALEIMAEVLQEYGIDRIDGTAISSITITPQKLKTHETFKIIDEEALINLGYYKVIVDEAAVKEAVTDALKRALRTFGNQFGNSLYDKSREHQHHNKTQNKPLSPHRQPSNKIPQDYSSLYNLGLTLVEQNGKLIVVGDDIFSKKDSIKACGFRWDSSHRVWYKSVERQVA